MAELHILLAELLQHGCCDEEYPQGRALASRLFSRLEQVRGGRFTHGERSSWMYRLERAIAQRFTDERVAVLLEVAPDLVPGQEILQAVDQYLEQQTAASRLPIPQRYHEVPKEPEALKAFRAEGAYTLQDALRARAQGHGRDWLHPGALARIERDLLQMFQQRVAVPARQLAPRSTRAPGATHLVGEEPDFIAQSLEQDFGAGTLTMDEVRQRIKLPLVFVEELKVGNEGRAEFERRTESRRHKELVRSMAGELRRLGYEVYAGGVGISGVYVLADLLAVDGEKLLFVECLTTASIQKGGHLKKLELARRVPLCLVGQVPPEFLSLLPPSSYALKSPYAPRMLDGRWIPRFYLRDSEQPAQVLISLKRGRVLTRISFEAGLRLPEDVSGFLWVAICEGRYPNLKNVPLPQGWKCKMPRAEIGRLRFNRHGMPNSTLILSNGESELTLRLGKVPVSAELRGTEAALSFLLEWFSRVGLPFVVVDSRGA